LDYVDPANQYDADFIRRFEAQCRPVYVNACGTESIYLIAVVGAY
jgi:hypothetical protein